MWSMLPEYTAVLWGSDGASRFFLFGMIWLVLLERFKGTNLLICVRATRLRKDSGVARKPLEVHAITCMYISLPFDPKKMAEERPSMSMRRHGCGVEQRLS